MKTARALLGNEITDQLPPEVWGLDSEGELNQIYRPSGHPGLWFAIGGFSISRFFSKHLVGCFPLSIYLCSDECDDTGSPDFGKRARYCITKGVIIYRQPESRYDYHGAMREDQSCRTRARCAMFSLAPLKS
jgi:hypothetical protein